MIKDLSGYKSSSGPSFRGGGPAIAKSKKLSPPKAWTKMADMGALSNFRQKESRRAADEDSNRGFKKTVGKLMLGKGYKG